MKPRRSVPSWIKDGAAVLYHPVIGRPEAHAGVVDGEPRKLCGSWVVTLRDMAPSYVEAFKRGARVVAASLEALERADLFTTAAAAPPPPERASDLHWQHRQTQDGPEWILFRGVYTIIVWPGDGFSQPKEGGRWQIREGRPGDKGLCYAVLAMGTTPELFDYNVSWNSRTKELLVDRVGEPRVAVGVWYKPDDPKNHVQDLIPGMSAKILAKMTEVWSFFLATRTSRAARSSGSLRS